MSGHSETEPARAGRRGSRRPERPRASAKDRALGLLAVRWRSRQELRRRLAQAGYDADDIESAIQDLTRAGLVDDDRFARAVVRDQASRRLAGDRVIRRALREKGVSPEVIDQALESTDDQDERAVALATRRAARLSSLAPEAAYRRLYGLLVRRGYPSGLAREAARRALEASRPEADLGDPE